MFYYLLSLWSINYLLTLVINSCFYPSVICLRLSSLHWWRLLSFELFIWQNSYWMHLRNQINYLLQYIYNELGMHSLTKWLMEVDLYFHGNVDRETAECRLMLFSSNDGTYLIRSKVSVLFVNCHNFNFILRSIIPPEWWEELLIKAARPFSIEFYLNIEFYYNCCTLFVIFWKVFNKKV